MSIAAAPEKLNDGLIVQVDQGWLRLALRADDIVRVAYAKNRAALGRPSLSVLPEPANPVAFQLESDPATVTLITRRLRVRADLASGKVSFLDFQGQPILAERERSMEPAQVQGEQTFHVRQQWQSVPGESLYGLGQNQLGLLDVRGHDLDLWQSNSVIYIPFLTADHARRLVRLLERGLAGRRAQRRSGRPF